MATNITVNFNNENYIATYNRESGFYELELQAPKNGGIYKTDILFQDLFGQKEQIEKTIQVFAKEKIKIETNKNFAWIFDGDTFEVKDIIELSNYEINIDEERNANSTIKILKETTSKSNDILAVKKNNVITYWGIIDNITNDNGKILYEFTVNYITNLFDRKVELKNEEIIKEIGIEDFIALTIQENFINNEDTYINKTYLEVYVETHTTLNKSVDNVENGIYNFHTWMTNCTQNYDIVYDFSIVNKKLRITIRKEKRKKELIDMIAQNISNYTEVYETDIVSKVTVKTKEGNYTLYLKNDRTTTENMLDKDRAKGKTELVFTEKMENAKQTALDAIRKNSYKHMIKFNLKNEYIKIGTPIVVKTKKGIIYDTYISAITITEKDFIEYTCGNMRTDFIDKILTRKG